MYEECVNALRTHYDDQVCASWWQNEYWGKTMLCYAKEDFLRKNPEDPDAKKHWCFNIWGQKYTLWALAGSGLSRSRTGRIPASARVSGIEWK